MTSVSAIASIAWAFPVVAADAAGIPFLDVIAEKGTLGIVIVFLLIVIRQLDKRGTEKDAALKVERDARLDDARKFTEGTLALNDKVHESVGELQRMIEYIERKRS